MCRYPGNPAGLHPGRSDPGGVPEQMWLGMHVSRLPTFAIDESRSESAREAVEIAGINHRIDGRRRPSLATAPGKSSNAEYPRAWLVGAEMGVKPA